MLAPIILFTYKRLDTLEITVTSLLENALAKESELFIFSDAARSEKDKKDVDLVRAFIRNINGFKKISIVEAETNKGLAKSIIEGVSQVLNTHDKAIVLEDDLQTSSNFLDFMNASLTRYEAFSEVFSISAYSFDLENRDVSQDVYFLNRGWSWGWGTWKSRWVDLDWDLKNYSDFKKDSHQQKQFAKGGSDLLKMLDKQVNGNIDSWAIRWFYNQFQRGGLTLYPVKSKINNLGFGEDATHTTGSNKRYIPAFDNSSKKDFDFPEHVEIDVFFQKRFQKRMGIVARIRSKIETVLMKFR